MIQALLHGPDGMPPRVTDRKKTWTHTDGDLRNVTICPEIRPRQCKAEKVESRDRAHRSKTGLLFTREIDAAARPLMPSSFDDVAACLNERFAKLAARIEQLRNGLREAEARSERLGHELVADAVPPIGFGGGRRSAKR